MEAAPLSEGKTGNLIVQLRAIVQLYYLCAIPSSAGTSRSHPLSAPYTQLKHMNKLNQEWNKEAYKQRKYDGWDYADF